jgi:hypothetical protein
MMVASERIHPSHGAPATRMGNLGGQPDLSDTDRRNEAGTYCLDRHHASSHPNHPRSVRNVVKQTLISLPLSRASSSR